MNTINTTTSQEYRFKISKKDVNKNKNLLPYILYETMETTAKESLYQLKDSINFKNNLFKLHLLKSAKLNDELSIKPKIEKFNHKEILLKIYVYKITNKKLEMICNATFGYSIENLNFELAS